MRLIFKLIGGQYRRHGVRTLLVLGAIATSVAMVVVVVGGQAAAAGTGQRQVNPRPLGVFDADVRAGDPDVVESYRHRSGILAPLPPFDAATTDWLERSAAVERVLLYGQMKGEAWVLGEMFTNAMYRPGQAMRAAILGTDAAQPPGALDAGRWLTGPSDDQVVIDSSMAGRLGGVGSTFTLTAAGGRFDVTVAGTLATSPTQPHKPKPIQPGQPLDLRARMRRFFHGGGVYVSPSLYARLAGRSLEPNRAMIQLRDGAEEEAFSDALITFTRQRGTPVAVQTTSQLVEQAENATMPGRRRRGGFFPILADAGMKLAILAAVFIIFNTFAMGVQERSRQLAMLRAIGLTRAQVVALIALDALVLSVLGWLIGVVGGWNLLRLGVIDGAAPESANFLPSAAWFGLGAITAFTATALAVAFPTFLAARKRPLEDMTPALMGSPAKWPWWLAALGLPLIALGPLAAYTTVLPEPARTNLFAPLSVLTAMVGFAMLAPLFIVVCERLFAALASGMLGLNRRLLAQRLSANLWQTVGCTTALMVGLGLYIIVQVWGQSMLSLFVVPDRHPDAVVTLFPEGLAADQLEDLNELPGVEAALPMILEHPAVAGALPDVQFGGLFARDVILLGCDAASLLDAERGMIGSTFIRGNATDAYRQLAQGRACLITDSFYVKAPQHYDVGKTIEVQTVEPPQHRMTYTIAGVVEIPGWQLLSKSANMRRGLGRTGGMVIVSPETARAGYPQADYRNLWFTLSDGVKPADLEQPILRLLDPDAAVVARSAPMPRGGRPGGRRGRGGEAAASRPAPTAATTLDSRFYCRVTDITAMTARIDGRAQGIIEAMTWYPLMALGLASLAVVSTVMMSVRTRSWELGILRSIGLTRGQLLRHVLAEGALIGLLACVVSLAMGLLTATASIAATSHGMGVTATYVIPWKLIAIGLAAAMAVSLLACVWPAALVSCRSPLRLLQDGRSVA
jgi:putative ABC transport system permease protein